MRREVEESAALPYSRFRLLPSALTSDPAGTRVGKIRPVVMRSTALSSHHTPMIPDAGPELDSVAHLKTCNEHKPMMLASDR